MCCYKIKTCLQALPKKKEKKIKENKTACDANINS